MLALTGHLPVEQKRGVVTLLGGEYTDTAETAEGGSASRRIFGNLVLPEVPAVAATRQQDSISLADLSVVLVWAHCKECAEEGVSGTPIADHLSIAFGAEHLPTIARISQLWREGKVANSDFGKLYPAVAKRWEEPSFRCAYFAWVQNSLLISLIGCSAGLKSGTSF
jgi:hypothetical protein